jgi:hypothetical protein
MKARAWTLTVLVVFAVPASAQRTSVSRDFPVYDNGGSADLTVDPQRFVAQMEIVDRYFDPIADECAFEEGVIGGAGYRRLLRAGSSQESDAGPLNAQGVRSIRM